MRRSCGCPYVHTNPSNTKNPNPSQKTNIPKNAPAAKNPRRNSESRAPFKEVQNRLVKGINKEQESKKENLVSANAETQTSFKFEPVHVQVPQYTIRPVQNLNVVYNEKEITIETQNACVQTQFTADNAIATTSTPTSVTSAKQDDFVSYVEIVSQTDGESSMPKLVHMKDGKKYNLNLQRKYATPAVADSVLNSSHGFMDAVAFFEKRPKSGDSSPIPTNPYISETVIISVHETGRRVPAQKKTLLRAKRAKIERLNEISVKNIDIFNTEYLYENFVYLEKFDQKYITKRNFLRTTNSRLSNQERVMVINWVLALQDDLQMTPSTYLKFVRLFDHILGEIRVARNMLQLVAIITVWILKKMHETTVPSLKKLMAFCANAYTFHEALAMEKKLLFFTSFNLNVSSPCDFFYCHMKCASIPLDHAFVYCIHYIIELFTFDLRYSTYASSEIASAGTYLAMKYFEYDLKHRLAKCKAYHQNIKSICDIVTVIDQHMKSMYINKQNSELEHVYKKYAGEQYLGVSVKIGQKIVDATQLF